MRKYPPKRKKLGQHFLKDTEIAEQIAGSITGKGNYEQLLEIGPGKGILTKHLLALPAYEFWVAEIDANLIAGLEYEFPTLRDHMLKGDFLKLDLATQFSKPFGIVGNFPYGISSQIVFRILEHRDLIPEMVGMFQREVAQRITAEAGSKKYGILSVLCRAWYNTEYLFELGPEKFYPPPKVHSAVIRLLRNKTKELPCDEKLFVRVVKAAFSQRRKTLRNALKSLVAPEALGTQPVFDKRAEQFSLEEFLDLTTQLQPYIQ